ncbi:hypothetical protein HDU76_011643, partial [Blyttiomyces sp. JEL0837]
MGHSNENPPLNPARLAQQYRAHHEPHMYTSTAEPTFTETRTHLRSHILKNQPTTITYKDLATAQKYSVSMKSSNEVLLGKMRDEKKLLHEKSGERVEKWTNTILGQRKIRLERIAVAERDSE